MKSLSDILAGQTRQALTGLAVVLSMLVYVAGLLYAGVRSYTLFSATIEPDLLWLAIVGIVALEVTALALPLAIHYWTAPGPQRIAAMIFYAADLALITFNSLLDAAHHSGAILPEFFADYSAFALPALPVLCMAGWALVWALDPVSREEDAKAAVRAATLEAVFQHMIQAAKSPDITAAVTEASAEAARALVYETLEHAPKRKDTPPMAAPVAPVTPPAVETPAPVHTQAPIPELSEPIRTRRNGHKAQAEDGPKA